MNDLNELFNGVAFNDYTGETEADLPLGLKNLENQAVSLSQDEEKIRAWISCYGLKTDNFPTIDETNTKIKSERNDESSVITYSLPFSGDHKFLFIRPNSVSHKLKCSIDELNKDILKSYPVKDRFSEAEQKAEISTKFKLFVSHLKESLNSLREDIDLFNEKVEIAVRSTVEETTKKAGNNELLVKDLQKEIKNL